MLYLLSCDLITAYILQINYIIIASHKLKIEYKGEYDDDDDDDDDDD